MNHQSEVGFIPPGPHLSDKPAEIVESRWWYHCLPLRHPAKNQAMWTNISSCQGLSRFATHFVVHDLGPNRIMIEFGWCSTYSSTWAVRQSEKVIKPDDSKAIALDELRYLNCSFWRPWGVSKTRATKSDKQVHEFKSKWWFSTNQNTHARRLQAYHPCKHKRKEVVLILDTTCQSSELIHGKHNYPSKIASEWFDFSAIFQHFTWYCQWNIVDTCDTQESCEYQEGRNCAFGTLSLCNA